MDRRSLLLGLGAILAAPAIVKADSLMKLWIPPKPKLVAAEVYWMSSRMFFVYNGGDQLVHLSMPTVAGEWAVTLDAGERKTFALPLTA